MPLRLHLRLARQIHPLASLCTKLKPERVALQVLALQVGLTLSLRVQAGALRVLHVRRQGRRGRRALQRVVGIVTAATAVADDMRWARGGGRR
jgi:hypothetical protein